MISGSPILLRNFCMTGKTSIYIRPSVLKNGWLAITSFLYPSRNGSTFTMNDSCCSWSFELYVTWARKITPTKLSPGFVHGAIVYFVIWGFRFIRFDGLFVSLAFTSHNSQIPLGGYLACHFAVHVPRSSGWTNQVESGRYQRTQLSSLLSEADPQKGKTNRHLFRCLPL